MTDRLPALLVALALAAAPTMAGDEFERFRPIEEPSTDASVLSVLPTSTPLGRGVLRFQVTHRFTQEIGDSSFHDLWGFDSGADIGLGVSYGFSPNFDAGIYRSSFVDEYVLHGRFRWFAQSAAIPLSVSSVVGLSWFTDPAVEEDERGGFVQLVLQRRFGRLTLIAAPSWISRTTSFDNALNVPAGFTLQLSNRLSVLGEVTARNRDNDAGATAWRVGLESRVPGHTFVLYFGNSRATTLSMDLASDFPGGFDEGDIRVGFNITRRWRW